MPMNEELLKVQLSPAEGRDYGTFTEGIPLAEAIGCIVVIQVDTKDGDRIRRFGRVAGVKDVLLNIDNNVGSDEQVSETYIYFDAGDTLVIYWSTTAVAVAEIAQER